MTPETPKPVNRVISYLPDISEAELEQTVAQFWGNFSAFLQIPQDRMVVRKLVLHEESPTALRRRAEKFWQISSRKAVATFSPLSRRVDLQHHRAFEKDLAHEMGHAAVRDICGQNLNLPHKTIDESVAQMAETLYWIWSNEGTTLDELRRGLQNNSEGTKQTWREYIGEAAIVSTGAVDGEISETREDWTAIQNSAVFDSLFIFLIQTREKHRFHHFLRSTHLAMRSGEIKSALEAIYGSSAEQLKTDCATWWYGEQ